MQPVLTRSGPHPTGSQLSFRTTTYVSWEAHHRGSCAAVLWTKLQERKVHMDGLTRTPSASSCWSSKWDNTVRGENSVIPRSSHFKKGSSGCGQNRTGSPHSSPVSGKDGRSAGLSYAARAFAAPRFAPRSSQVLHASHLVGT